MTEQASEAVNPGLAIYHSLRPEAKAAVDALPDYPFVGPEAGEKAKQLVATLKHMNGKGLRLWEIYPDSNGDVELRVRKLKVVSCYRLDRLGLLVRRAEHFPPVIKRIIDQNATSWRSASYPEFRRIVSTAEMRKSSDYQRILDAHFSAVDQLVSTVRSLSQPTVGTRHRDDWRVRLAVITGEDVPAPDYVPKHNLGFPTHAPVLDINDVQEMKDSFPVATSEPNLQAIFKEYGLAYTDQQVRSFYTALQTKGFVILSGISGTGKSKLAQRFADVIEVEPARSPERVDVEFVRPIEPYMKKYNLFVVPKELAGQYQAPQPGTGYSVKLEVDGVAGAGRLQNPMNLKTGAGWSVRLSWKGLLRDRFANIDAGAIRVRMRLRSDGRVETVDISPELDDVEVSNAIETMPVISGPSANHLFLPVRPDWRDGKALIGYLNPLTNEYVRTPFLGFVIAAGDDYRAGNRNAFFVILDEMNLAYVEYYFADVLSVLECGRDEEGWTVEGIPLAVGEEDADLPDVLRLPPNLYIVGSVNMDETTHPFSPKVLDRAFTIELTDVDFSDYPPAPVDADVALEDEERRALLRAFTRDGRYPRIDKGEIREAVERHPRFRADLDCLNTSLRRYRMHFGYRVFDEIMQFVHNADENGLFTPDEAFDQAVLMKVLPKFNGSRAKLENALFELLHWARSGGVMSQSQRAELEARLAQLTDTRQRFDAIVISGSESAGDDWRYPATGRRAALMMQDLYTDGFAAFG